LFSTKKLICPASNLRNEPAEAAEAAERQAEVAERWAEAAERWAEAAEAAEAVEAAA